MPKMKKIICFFKGEHRGESGINPENNNTESLCRTCSTWFNPGGSAPDGDYFLRTR